MLNTSDQRTQLHNTVKLLNAHYMLTTIAVQQLTDQSYNNNNALIFDRLMLVASTLTDQVDLHTNYAVCKQFAQLAQQLDLTYVLMQIADLHLYSNVNAYNAIYSLVCDLVVSNATQAQADLNNVLNDLHSTQAQQTQTNSTATQQNITDQTAVIADLCDQTAFAVVLDHLAVIVQQKADQYSVSSTDLAQQYSSVYTDLVQYADQMYILCDQDQSNTCTAKDHMYIHNTLDQFVIANSLNYTLVQLASYANYLADQHNNNDLTDLAQTYADLYNDLCTTCAVADQL